MNSVQLAAMPLSVEMKRDVVFAPTRHVTNWALNPIYTSGRVEA